MATYFVNSDGTVESSRPTSEPFESPSLSYRGSAQVVRSGQRHAQKTTDNRQTPNIYTEQMDSVKTKQRANNKSRADSVCHLCGVAMKSSRLEKHIRSKCPRRPPMRGHIAPSAAKVSGRSLESLSIAASHAAGSGLKANNSRTCLSEPHGQSSKPSGPTAERQKGDGAQNDRVQCPKCRDSIVRHRMDHHLRRVHNTSLPSTTQPGSYVGPPSKIGAKGTPPTTHKAQGSDPKKGQPQPSTIARSGKRKSATNAPRATQRESGDERSWEPRGAERRGQDGSSGVGHFAREDGRFGSFPSFDPMDDESGA
jgi:hypothetical protein